jgi:type II secretory pathway component PulF
MPAWETKLKLGRKLEGDAGTASDNQASVLFRYDPESGQDGHVSFSVESDQMTGEDVAAVLQLLHQRGVLPARGTKTWMSQPQASEQKFGKTTSWKGTDLKNMVDLLAAGLPVRDSAPTQAGDALGKLREAQMRVAELQKKVEELRAALG